MVNVGRSDDDTLELVRSIRDPKIRIVETEWDMTRRNTVLGARDASRHARVPHPWGIYIQADEVLHERGAAELAAAIQRHDGDPRVEGLLVRYLHFYGGFDTIATHRRWYRREVRAVRLDPALDIRPYQGAQGFRVGPEHRKIRARLTERGDVPLRLGPAGPGAAREARARQDDVPVARRRRTRVPLLAWVPGIRRFAGAHPRRPQRWIEPRAARSRARDRAQALPAGGSCGTMSPGLIERLTGIRVFEFRNYTLV